MAFERKKSFMVFGGIVRIWKSLTALQKPPFGA